MKFFTIILLLLLSLNLYAQEALIIKGQVIDDHGTPVSFANVGIKGTYIGTATNEQGYFELNVTTIHQDSYLMFSAISYKTHNAKLSDLEGIKHLKIKLKPHFYLMDEVVISSKNQDAKPIVEKALNNYHKNYLQKRYQLKGFYRELLRNDDSYVYLTEAKFTMDDRGYHKTQDKRFRLDALRKSDDFRQMDSLDRYYDRFSSDNDFNSMFMRDYIDANDAVYSFPFWPSVNESFLNNFEFMLDSMSYYDGELVYCIAFYTDVKAIGWEWFKKKSYEYNRLVINASDYAIIEMEVKSAPKEITKTKDNKKGNISRLIDGKFYGSTLIKYKKYKANWYPYILSRYKSVIGGDRQKSSNMAYQNLRKEGVNELDYDDVVYNGKKLDPDKNNYYVHRQIMITTVKDKSDGIDKIKGVEMMGNDTYVRDHEKPYNPIDWTNLNAILMDTDLKAAKKHLETHNSLEVQFVKNSKDN